MMRSWSACATIASMCCALKHASTLPPPLTSTSSRTTASEAASGTPATASLQCASHSQWQQRSGPQQLKHQPPHRTPRPTPPLPRAATVVSKKGLRQNRSAAHMRGTPTCPSWPAQSAGGCSSTHSSGRTARPLSWPTATQTRRCWPSPRTRATSPRPSSTRWSFGPFLQRRQLLRSWRASLSRMRRVTSCVCRRCSTSCTASRALSRAPVKAATPCACGP